MALGGGLVSYLEDVGLLDDDEGGGEEGEEGGDEGRGGGAGGGRRKEQEKKGVVQLMTVHASKGLEFDAVFIAGLERGTFPLPPDRAAYEEERSVFLPTHPPTHPPNLFLPRGWKGAPFPYLLIEPPTRKNG